MNINFCLNNYGRLSYLMKMTELRKKDKREIIYLDSENLPENKRIASEKRRAEIETELKKIFE